MRATETHGLIARGIIHCHTALSYDSQVGLSELCSIFRKEGFNFVALTEHTQDITPEDYSEFVGDCQTESSDEFIVIPGLEISCGDGFEIAGIGIAELVKAGSPSYVTAQIRKLGGYAIWVHPLKHGRWNGRIVDCDAVEVLNGKVDGTIAPSLALVRGVKRCRRGGKSIHAIFGLDLHDVREPLCVWTECTVPALTTFEVVASLNRGQFVNRVARGALGSSGEVTPPDLFRFVILRTAYIAWNTFLEALPEAIRGWVIRITRPLVRRLKRE